VRGGGAADERERCRGEYRSTREAVSADHGRVHPVVVWVQASVSQGRAIAHLNDASLSVPGSTAGPMLVSFRRMK
jgi:hypothetical protein